MARHNTASHPLPLLQVIQLLLQLLLLLSLGSIEVLPPDLRQLRQPLHHQVVATLPHCSLGELGMRVSIDQHALKE